MKKILEQIDYSNPMNKEKMNDLFYMLMCSTENNDKGLYDHVKCEVNEIIYGKKITPEIANWWVECMNPAAKWNRKQVEEVATQYGINIPIDSAYVLFNMLYSDNSNIYGDGNSTESLEKYIQGVKDWYMDEDLKINGEEKLYNYWKYIVKAN